MDTQDLMWATEAGKVREVGTLLDAGADADARTAGGETPLMRAAARGHANVVQLLLERGAAANLTRPDGWTALMLASFFGHVDVVRTLVCAGADIKVSDRNGSDAVTWAMSRGHVEVARLLRDAKLLMGDFERGRPAESVASPPSSQGPRATTESAENFPAAPGRAPAGVITTALFRKASTAAAAEVLSDEGEAIRDEEDMPAVAMPRREARAAPRPFRVPIYAAAFALLLTAGGLLAYFNLNLPASPPGARPRPEANAEAEARVPESGGEQPRNVTPVEPIPPAPPSETINPAAAPDMPHTVADFPPISEGATSPAATKSVRGRTAASLPATRDATVVSSGGEPSVVGVGAEGNTAESRREEARGASQQSPASPDTVERREEDAAPSSSPSATPRQSEPTPEPSPKKKPKEIRWP